jgi:hypothetical protein
MAITTTPVFYYIESVGLNNRFIDINEGSGELSTIIPPSGYSPTELAVQIQTQLNLTGTQFYTVTFNRDERTYTISAPSNFDLLVSSGTNAGLSVYQTIGFLTDQTGTNTYTSEQITGSEYIPQFPLQDFRGFEDNEDGVDASVNEAASGVVEVITYGRRRFMSFNIKYIKDGQPCSDSIYGDDPNAVQNARDFLSFCIGKARLEFMKDNNDRTTFDTILLEKTRKSSKGTAYELRELYNENLLGYYETGRLEFRKIE